MSGRTVRAPARIKVSTPLTGEAAIVQALAEGGRYVDSPRGRILVGPFVHELERVDVELAYRGRVLNDPIDLAEEGSDP